MSQILWIRPYRRASITASRSCRRCWMTEIIRLTEPVRSATAKRIDKAAFLTSLDEVDRRNSVVKVQREAAVDSKSVEGCITSKGKLDNVWSTKSNNALRTVGSETNQRKRVKNEMEHHCRQYLLSVPKAFANVKVIPKDKLVTRTWLGFCKVWFDEKTGNFQNFSSCKRAAGLVPLFFNSVISFE